MVQETQTALDWYTFPNRIEGIWISERQIKEHTQVTPFFSFWCLATSSLSHYASASERQAPLKQWTFTVTQYWNTEFSVVNKSLRIPIAWGYLAKFTFSWGASSFKVTSNIIVAWEQIVSEEIASSTPVVVEKLINVWKYETIEFRSSWYYSGSSSWATINTNVQIELKKL